MTLAVLQRTGGWRGGEPTLADALADPLTRALMAADHVDPAELEADLKELGRALRRRFSIPAPCSNVTA